MASRRDNAHPHMDTAMRVAVVQNGIIEKLPLELCEELKQLGTRVPPLILRYRSHPTSNATNFTLSF